MELAATAAHTKAILAGFAMALMLLSFQARAGCNINSWYLSMARTGAAKSPESSGGHSMLAGTYVDAGCYTDALRELDLADEKLTREGGSPDLKSTKAVAQQGLRKLIISLQRLESGERTETIESLFSLLDTNYATMVRMQTTMMLGEILAPDSTESQWAKFDGYLRVLDPEGTVFWQVPRFRRLHEAYSGRVIDALRNLSKDLERESAPQHHLALQVVLAEVMVIGKRFASARIQCARTQETIQSELVDLRLRQRFLTACLASWRSDTRVSRDPRTAVMIRLQEAALAKFEALY